MNSLRLNYRLVIFFIAIIFGVGMSMPTFLQTEKGAKISLGLDLQGGLHMLLGVKTEEAIKSKEGNIGAVAADADQSPFKELHDLKSEYYKLERRHAVIQEKMDVMSEILSA